MRDKRLLLIGVDPVSLINFRGHLIKQFVLKYDQVDVASLPTSKTLLREINKLGVVHHSISFKRNAISPWSDLVTLVQIICLINKIKPDIVMAYTIKPVIFGGLASRICQKKFIALITGLGFALQGKTLWRRLLIIVVTNLYKQALKRAKIVLFQNVDNQTVFLEKGITKHSKTGVVSGSGVDISHYQYRTLPPSDKFLVFLCIARLLGEKGLREYVLAAEQIRKTYSSIIFRLLGSLDTSPDGITKEEVKHWQSKGIEYLGTTDDVRPFIHDCHVFVLPSYHEGLPRSTLEAMSIGRPILTTDAVGCKETVIKGRNGFKVAVGSVDELIEKMLWFINHTNQLEQMGIESRQLVLEKFDVNKVNQDIINRVEHALDDR